MSKFYDILNNGDASDALLGEQIDKMNTWNKSIISDANAVKDGYFTTSDFCIRYVNPGLRRVVVILRGTTAKELNVPSGLSVGIINEDEIPFGSPRVTQVTSSYTASLSKNASNTVVAFSTPVGKIPAGTNINLMIEWQLF